MQDKDFDAKYIEEYRQLVRKFASMAVNDPDMIGLLREALMTSASLMISNRAEAVTEFQELAKEVDALLSAFETGKIDPRTFLISFDKNG